MRFTLQCQASEGDTKITHEFSTDNLGPLIENLEIFIKASGFCFDGYLNIYENDDPTKPKFERKERP